MIDLKRNKLKIFFILLLISFHTYAGIPTVDNKPMAYYANGDYVERLKPQDIKNALPLPNSLIISPGFYNFSGRVYKVDKPGLYRFYWVGNYNEQRIVYGNDIHALMSSLAWISTHGNLDNNLPQIQLENAAMKRKLVLTCGSISVFASNILTQLGITSRVTALMTLDEWNDYDVGHVMLEVFLPGNNKWVVYDLDTKNYFVNKNSGERLSLLELYQQLKTDNFKIISLSNNTKLDTINFTTDGSIKYNYQFVTEEYSATLPLWYKHMVQVILRSSYYLCEDKPEHKRRIESVIKATYINEDEFKRKYY